MKALRDGYLLPVSAELTEDYVIWGNIAVIEDELHWVWANDDYTEWASYIVPLPSRPIPLD